MKVGKTSLTTLSRLPALAASVAILWFGSTNIHFNAVNTQQRGLDVILARPADRLAVTKPSTSPQNLAVLTPKDAELYRAAFAAQADGDEKTADRALDGLKDERLVGHVLADRYTRLSASTSDLKAWLDAYADLPEAEAIYDAYQERPQAAQDGDAKTPSGGSVWAGAGGEGVVSATFKTDQARGKMSASFRRLADKVAQAIHRGEPEKALSVLEAETTKAPLAEADHTTLKARIAAAFLHNGQTDKARQLADDAAQTEVNSYALWLSGLAAWKQNDNAAAAKSFVKLASLSNVSETDHAAAAFWAYRALTKTGATAEARGWLEQAAAHPRNFYGFMAAHLLGRTIDWTWKVPALTKSNLAALTNKPAGWRALALLQVGQTHLAEEELRRLNPRGNQDLQDAMLALADREQMPALALQMGGLVKTAEGRPYDAALYPVPSWKPAQGFQVDPALIYAIMHRESRFDPEAVSPQGACGLMQLMPATAAKMAQDDTASNDCTSAMREPSRNMALGQDYVQHLASLPMIGDNLLLLLAAYNGGPGNLAHWLDNSTSGDPLLFIESLPSRETHDYVQQVLMHYWTYRARLKEPETSLSQIATGEWPRYAALNGSAKTAEASRRIVASAR